ncbi:hypothetical protein PybrP1_004559 [[Pythium] brassicae (nom. inval.)]|nr:hypothetical protein PybrP1_004559 [[Pythium] brassicae (nom. inval.)]
MRKFFFDSSKSMVQRMPSMRTILKDLSKNRPPVNARRASGVSARTRVIRDYESHYKSDEGEVTYRWVILPRAPWKVRWDLWIGLIIFYSVVLIPYRIGFGIDIESWEQVLNIVFDASFGLDVVFNFFTGFYDADIFIHELPKIRERYLKSWCLIDLLSTVPFDQLLQAVSSASSSLATLKLLRTIRLFRLLKLMRLLRLKRAIETIQMDALNAHVLQTLKSLLMIVFIIHLVSCGWYLFYTWDPDGTNWVTNLDKRGLANPYLVSFYWVSNTMMSVGYGDIYGVTDAERAYSIFVEALGSISVGMIIANIQMLTENYNPRGIKLKQKLQETKEFLLKRNIPRRLRQRVLSQFEYHWSHRTVFDEDKLLHQFPVSLQYEILAASMELFVKRFPFFGVTSVDFFVFTIPRLRPIVLGPGQTLVDAESVWEELYFITTGSVESIRANIIVGSLTPGDICGIEYLVAYRKRYTHTYRSVQKTELFAIYSRDLVEAIRKCPIAHKYLTDLATILSERYAESARRERRAILKEQSLRRQQDGGAPAPRPSEPYLQYRHRKSLSYNNIHAHELDNLRRLNVYATDEVKTHWSVIRHYSRLRMVWDVVIGIMVAMTAVVVPFRISFDIQDTDFLYLSDRVSDVGFLLDILLSFLTTYVDETGVEIIDRHEIRRHYLKTSFLVDVVSTIPFDFIVESLSSFENYRSLKLFRTIKLVKLLRLIRLSKLYKMNVQWASELDISMDTLRLLKLLAPVMTIAHYVGCFWYYMSAQHAKEDSWWGRIHMDDPNSIISKYVASVYWAATTMTTVGFGDIFAVNSYEQAYSTLVMIGGTTLFAYVVGTVIEVVSNSKSLLNREHEMIQKVNAYIKERGVSSEFTMACQEHLRFLNAEKTLFDEPGLFDALCYGLRSELILYLNNNILAKIRFFDKKPKWFLTLILPRLVPQYFLAGDLLIYHGNPVSGIFFLTSGVVVVKAPQLATTATVFPHNGGGRDDDGSGASAPRDDNIAMLYEGEFFGYKEVLTHTLAQYNAFAVKSTGTYLLPREFLEGFQADYPHVMDEMKAMLMHSINKQQTIVHHWQNNDAIGIFGEEKENFLRHQAQSHFQDAGLGDIPESSYEDTGRSSFVRGDKPTAPDPSESPADVYAEPPRSRRSSLVGMRSRSQVSILEDAGEDDGDAEYGEDPEGDHTALDELAGDARAESLLASQGGAVRILRHASSSRIHSKDKMAAVSTTTRPRRDSIIGIASSSVGASVAAARAGKRPPLKRYPSNPAEIDAIVKSLLLVEGYRSPHTDTNGNTRPL